MHLRMRVMACIHDKFDDEFEFDDWIWFRQKYSHHTANISHLIDNEVWNICSEKVQLNIWKWTFAHYLKTDIHDLLSCISIVVTISERHIQTPVKTTGVLDILVVKGLLPFALLMDNEGCMSDIYERT